MEWNAGLKGCYNPPVDLKRVDTNTIVLAELLNNAGHPVTISPFQGWMPGKWPTVSDMERIRHNIQAIRNAMSLPSGVPQVPDSLERMGVYSANAIEHILFSVYTMLNNAKKSMQRVSTFFAGGGVLL